MDGYCRPYTLINPEVDLSYSVIERFVRYVKVYTQSAMDSTTHPSTERQFDLAHILADEMKAIGLADVRVDEHCYVYGTLSANTNRNAPVIALPHRDRNI